MPLETGYAGFACRQAQSGGVWPVEVCLSWRSRAAAIEGLITSVEAQAPATERSEGDAQLGQSSAGSWSVAANRNPAAWPSIKQNGHFFKSLGALFLFFFIFFMQLSLADRPGRTRAPATKWGFCSVERGQPGTSGISRRQTGWHNCPHFALFREGRSDQAFPGCGRSETSCRRSINAVRPIASSNDFAFGFRSNTCAR